jgi:hypothetical protein
MFVHVSYPLFQAAIRSGNLEKVRQMAREVGPVTLTDALLVLLLYRDQDARRFEAAAVRWLGRFALEGHGVEIADLREATDALAELRTNASAGMLQIQELCLARGIR